MNSNSTKSHEPLIAHTNRTHKSKVALKSFLLAFLLVCGHFTLSAATITVTNGNDAGAGSLRAAIASAVAGDDIAFSGVTTVTLTSAQLFINKNLTINGGTGVTITRDASAGDFRIFNVSSGVTVVFNKLTITNGKDASQAGSVENNGTLTLNDCVIANNQAGQGGGLQNNGIMTMNRCFVHSNTMTAGGGGCGLIIYSNNTTTLNNCVFTNNQVGYAIDIQSAGTLNITNCTIAKNTGGVNIGNGSAAVTLKNTIVVENTGASSANIRNNVSASSAYNLIGTEGGNGGLTNGTNNNFVGSSPLFANSSDPDGADEIFGTADDGLILLTCSPALNAGNTANAPAGTDIVGNMRTFGTNVDMGAYEAQTASTPLPTITLGTIPTTILAGATTFNIPYTATGTPTTYSISGTGFTTLTDAALPSSPITVNLSPAASINIDFTLTVKSASGCTSSAKTGSIAVLTPLTDACATANFNGTAPIAPTATTAGVGGKGGIFTYTVPAGVTAIRLDARGAKGGSSPNHFNNTFVGGQGGRVQATYAVTPGDVLYILVGGKGGNGSIDNGVQVRTASGGGGATVVSKGPIGTGTLLLVAGGGGGAGHSGGGGNSNNAPNTGAGAIGAGGASFSANGGNSTVGDIGERDCGQGGQALNAGGNGGANACFRPETNGGGYGGGGAGNYSTPNGNAGGGGGGGYVGGNGGGTAGGNGGSSYTDPSATNRVPDLGKNETHTDDNGSVVITVAATISYTGSPFCKSLTATAAPTTTGYTGGTFSSTAGLTIDATTGVINPSTSTAGTYTVSYNTLVGCAAATTTVTIRATTTPSVSISPTAICAGTSPTLNATAMNGGNSPQFTWTKNNVSVGTGNTLPVSNAVAGDVYQVTLVPSAEVCPNSATAMASVRVSDCFAPSISCPPTIRIEFNQLTANGLAMPEVTGFLKTFIQVDNVTYSDQIFNINCGTITGGNSGFNQSLLADAIQVLTRTFIAKNTVSIISYSCSQQIYVGAPKLADVVFPTDKILPCADSRIEPTDTSINHYTVLGTGYPTVFNQVVGEGLVKNLTQTYTDQRITNPNGFTIKRTWVIKNVCTGETRTFVQNLTYRSDAGTCPTALSTISGKIRREDLMEIPAKISVFNAENELLNDATNPAYSFTNLLVNKGYRVTAERPNTDWTNGVTTFDVALISRHVLGITPLSTPYQIIAADANRNGEVDAADLLHLQRLILRLDNQLPNNNSWRFVPKSYQFLDPTNPFASDFPEVLNVSNLTSAVTNGDFVAIKVGDVNSSLGATSIRGDVKPFLLNTEDKVLEKGKTYHIPIQLTPSVSSLQFTLNVVKNAAKIDNIETGNLPNFTDNNTGLFQKQGIITAVWYRKDGQSLSETDYFTMMTVTLIPTKNTRLSEIMSINSAYTEGVAYDAKGTGLPVQLTFGNQKTSSEKTVLLPNRPNPFSQETIVPFILSETNKAVLTVYDIMGRQVFVSNKDFKMGYNEVILNKSILQNTGTYFYRLTTENYSLVKSLQFMAE